MKKLLVVLLFIACSGIANAMTVLNVLPTKEQVKFVNKVGYRLLNANRIADKITFAARVEKNPTINTTHRNNEITITTSLLEALDTDDELAALLAHEIAHGVDYRKGAFKGYFTGLSSFLSPKKYEYKADKRAVDYLVKAGYNPLALIVAINKIYPQTRYDWCSMTPLTTRRLSEVYEYVYVKYPQYLVQNEYKDNMIYQNFLITSKENRAKFEQKVNSNSKRKVNYL